MRGQGCGAMLHTLKRTFAPHKLSGAPRLRPQSRRGLLVWRAVLVCAVALVLFTVAGFFAVPPIARYYLAKELSALLDRQVTVEDVDLNPFTMVAAVKGLSI